jgi:hypothetical protein
VRDQDGRLAERVPELDDEIRDELGALRIEPGGRLVVEEDLRIPRGQCAPDRHPPLHPARHLVRHAVDELIVEADPA